MSDRLVTQSPVDVSIYVERPYATRAEIDRALDVAVRAQQGWKRVPLKDRITLVSKAVDAFVARKAELANEITWQMGRPVSQSPGEIGGFEDRARATKTDAGYHRPRGVHPWRIEGMGRARCSRNCSGRDLGASLGGHGCVGPLPNPQG